MFRMAVIYVLNLVLERIEILEYVILFLVVHLLLFGIAEYILAIVIQIVGNRGTGPANSFLDQELRSGFLIRASVLKSQEMAVLVQNNDKANLFVFPSEGG